MHEQTMSLRKNCEKYVELKKLLASWGLDDLFQHLKDEEIGIQELSMMKFHHLNELLCNFKLGIRIRFEYHFEKWRHSVYKPLEKRCKIDYSNEFNKPNKLEQQQNISRNIAEAIIEQQQQPKNSQPIVPTLYLPPKQNKEQIDSTIRTNALKRNSTEIDDNSDSQVTVLKILYSFGRPGQSLIEFYEQNQCFTAPQRLMLIQLIVSFFEINDYHLSLNTSYALEKQIVKYFPNEKLEYYRTEKRGKIYSKYSNMKRKRAETLAAVKPMHISLTPQDTRSNEQHNSSVRNDDDNGQETDMCDDSSEQDFIDLPIKIECASD